MYGVLILAALWHLALVVTQKERKFYLAYAAFHFPVFYFFWAFALVFAISFRCSATLSVGDRVVLNHPSISVGDEVRIEPDKGLVTILNRD